MSDVDKAGHDVGPDTGYSDFEFERRFFVRDFPRTLRDAPALIVQSYFVADDGYALRVRVQASDVEVPQERGGDPATVLGDHAGEIDFAAVTVKGPAVGGTRYEAERPVDPSIAVELVRRGGHPVVKTRYAAWLGADGWSIDVFGGANHPLVIAECERSRPVTGLEIPDFCITEITDDARFSNDSLAVRPYDSWSAAFDAELAAEGPRFRQDFGPNSRLGTG
ncbi:CYTH domain-containing protein [Myceligenerans salitolerans]|uniref:CYTH domain-containing protein n=1 Tax=Myceligenerans salitolerans TaxID=1230528 RepID=A0ABS3I782_9MICO|nr:CYTH domain-containing protein [Myceligenerans salitolerans]MBO0608856.1 CYTH domain-containing protein [Myceligenerans salitolerans]